MNNLPLPSPEALAVSQALLEKIAQDIHTAGGWISFARYMELALYTPGLGYYSGNSAKLGPGPQDGSDFTTAPELTPLFGRTLARQIAQIMEYSAPHILEFGAGSGKFAADILLELERMECLPQSYAILDLSADLRLRQAETLSQLAPHLLNRVVWLDQLPEQISGAVIGNEVLDAMPVELVVKTADGWMARGVSISGNTLQYVDRPLNTGMLAAIPDTDPLPLGYVTEIAPLANAFTSTLVSRMVCGVAVLIDYGFPAHEYYHPQRAGGTLMMHYRHHSHANPFLWPGLQDITTHVNFSAIAQAAFEAGGNVAGYTSQAGFLINCGIVDLLRGDPNTAQHWLPQTNALQKLVSEAEMGELFKVMALAKGLHGDVAEQLIGFTRMDRRAML